MHLAVTFADIIIKIRKCIRPKQHAEDEDISYGVIDDSCVFSQSDGQWTNGSEYYLPNDFETYLRKK